MDADGFRGLLGVAPDGKLAVLESLLGGDSSLEDLVGASGLPRRDVEEFTAALGLSESASDADRDSCRKLLADYRASRARVRPQDEPDLERAAAELIAGVPAPRKRLDHVQATPGTLVRRVAWLTSRFDLSGRSVLFAGDHDLTSPLLARVVPDARLSVADIDEDLLAYIDTSGGGRVRCAWADFRCGLPPALAESADVVFTDPPYTPEGLGLFLIRSVTALSRRDPGGRIVVAYGHSRRRPDLGLAAQREIARQDLVIDAMLPGFSRYAGAQAVGSASDLYCLQPAPAAFRHAGTASFAGIYTHGEQSVESGAANAADLIPQLARITSSGTADPAAVGVVAPDPGTARGFVLSVSLAKLLADGVHPSVTARASEIVADLRDDPGPWLLRAMLALNAQRSVFVVPRRHEALNRLAEGTPEWDLPHAKFASVSPVPVGDLVAVRCVLAPGPSATGPSATPASGSDPEITGAPDGPADPGLTLTRFVTRRAHGRLRNVWREGLVEASGGTLTKRQAADLAAGHAGDGSADLALRLIDIPTAHFQDLQAVLRASAEAV